MISRRKFTLGSFAALLTTSAISNNDPTGPINPFGAPRKAWVSQPAIVKQACPQWCWAASISMVFAKLGHPVDQLKIVQQTFGALVCAPAMSSLTIAQDLSRPWVDDNGIPFNSTVTAAYDPANGITNLNNFDIINNLSNNKPLLYCNRHHAMVLVIADYLDTMQGPIMTAGAVLDPWPGSPDWHYLTRSEFYPAHLGGEMTFLASVEVF